MARSPACYTSVSFFSPILYVRQFDPFHSKRHSSRNAADSAFPVLVRAERGSEGVSHLSLSEAQPEPGLFEFGGGHLLFILQFYVMILAACTDPFCGVLTLPPGIAMRQVYDMSGQIRLSEAPVALSLAEFALLFGYGYCGRMGCLMLADDIAVHVQDCYRIHFAPPRWAPPIYYLIQ